MDVSDRELGIKKLKTSAIPDILRMGLRWVRFDYKSFSYIRASIPEIEKVVLGEEYEGIELKQRGEGDYVIKIHPTLWYETMRI